MCLDFLETYVSAMAITATLGSMLPYLFGKSFAMCVFNQLHIDLRCGPSGYPKPLSYANYICCVDDLYLMYPSQTHGNRIPFLPQYRTCWDAPGLFRPFHALIAFILRQPRPTTRRRRHRLLQYIPYPMKPFPMIRTYRDL